MKSQLKVRLSSRQANRSDAVGSLPLIWRVNSLSDKHHTFTRSVDWVEYLVRKARAVTGAAADQYGSTHLVSIVVEVSDDEASLEFVANYELTSSQYDRLRLYVSRFHCEVVLGWHSCQPKDDISGTPSSVWEPYGFQFEHIVLEGDK